MHLDYQMTQITSEGSSETVSVKGWLSKAILKEGEQEETAEICLITQNLTENQRQVLWSN